MIYENRKNELVKEISKVIQQVTGNEVIESDGLSMLDSLAFISIIVSIEKKYSFEFEDEMLDYSHLSSVEKIAEYIMKKEKG